MKIEVTIPTKNRYENLALLLWSLCEQTYRNFVVTIVDDSEDRKDIRELPYILPILKRLDQEGHEWRVRFGKKMGPHHCHQMGLEQSRCEYIFRVDDDCILDRSCLSELVKVWESGVGAVGPVVINPSVLPEFRQLPEGFASFKKYQGKIDEYGKTYGEHQWGLYPTNELQFVEHLYSSFLYSVKVANEIGGYDLEFGLPGHREETDFSYRIFKAGYKLCVQPTALVWHLRNPSGGIRSFRDVNLWNECHEHFIDKFGFRRGRNQDKVVKIFGGLGDHLCATPLLRSLRRKGEKVVISSVYPYIFAGNPNVDELIFTPDEKEYKNVDNRKVYGWAFDNKFEGKLSEAWCKMYGEEWDGDKLDFIIFPKEREWVVSDVLGGENFTPFIVIGPFGATPVIQIVEGDKTFSSRKMTVVRDWFKDAWEVLVKKVQGKGLQVFQVGGVGEEKIEGCDKHLNGISYRKTIALLERSSGFVTIDSFLQHAGHAIGKKGVVLFGPSDLYMTGHESNVNIKTNECDQGYSCTQSKHSKDQWTYKSSDCGSRLCMKTITVDMVLDGLISIFEKRE